MRISQVSKKRKEEFHDFLIIEYKYLIIFNRRYLIYNVRLQCIGVVRSVLPYLFHWSSPLSP